MVEDVAVSVWWIVLKLQAHMRQLRLAAVTLMRTDSQFSTTTSCLDILHVQGVLDENIVIYFLCTE